MNPDQRLVSHARQWGLAVEEIRSTETSVLGFGTKGAQPVVLEVIRRENSEEWRCGEVLEAFAGAGMILPIAHAPGAVLLPRLVPGYDLVALVNSGHDDEACRILASLIQRRQANAVAPTGIGSVGGLQPDFARFRDRCEGFIPAAYVERAEALFVELCATERAPGLLHGDLHHYNVLYDETAGWTAMDPWGVVGEIEFELGASLRNPIVPSVGNPCTIERRLRVFQDELTFDSRRALEWAFATTVLAIIWPFDPAVGQDLRTPFALAARAMRQLIDEGAS